MKEIYGIDMEANGQHSKLITDIPDVDIAISMGCNVGCPFIGRAFDDNWGLDDPTGKSDDDFKAVIQRIEENIMELIGICGTGNLDYMRRGEYSNAIVHAFQRFRAPFSGKIVHIFPEQSAVI